MTVNRRSHIFIRSMDRHLSENARMVSRIRLIIRIVQLFSVALSVPWPRETEANFAP